MTKTGTIVVVVVLAVLALVAWEWRDSPFFSKLFGSASTGQLVAQVHYQCDGGKTIEAGYYSGGQPAPVQAGQPPVPTGTVHLVLSDNRAMALPQTISADGARYATKDESFVFWNKGNGALVLENGQEKSFIGCIEVAADPGTLPQVYESGQKGFSIRYPAAYTADETYVYQNLGPGKDIKGVKFTIDPAIATGTNLGSDSYISVERLATSTATAGLSCTADRFLERATPSVWVDGTNQYSYASSTGAGAGNRYEEQVFALPGTNPCVAVRYFIHYGVIDNYPAGMVQQFNHDALVGQFDTIRKTLTIVQ